MQVGGGRKVHTLGLNNTELSWHQRMNTFISQTFHAECLPGFIWAQLFTVALILCKRLKQTFPGVLYCYLALYFFQCFQYIMNFFRGVRGYSVSSTANDKLWIIHTTGFFFKPNFLFSFSMTPAIAFRASVFPDTFYGWYQLKCNLWIIANLPNLVCAGHYLGRGRVIDVCLYFLCPEFCANSKIT